MKRWLLERGINPNQRCKAVPSITSTPPALRDLEPYPFDSTTNQAVHRQSSALDHLFERFIHKQEETLEEPGIAAEAVTGDDTKAGLERLFGSVKTGLKEQQTPEEKEDDALARLLEAMGTNTPVPQPATLEPKQNKLLAVLNSKQTPSPILDSSSVRKTPSPKSSIGAHQNSLPAVLSLKARASISRVDPAGPTLSHPSASPRSTSPTGQTERSRKQLALLEQITAGFGTDAPSQGLPTFRGAPPTPQQQTIEPNNIRSPPRPYDPLAGFPPSLPMPSDDHHPTASARRLNEQQLELLDALHGSRARPSIPQYRPAQPNTAGLRQYAELQQGYPRPSFQPSYVPVHAPSHQHHSYLNIHPMATMHHQQHHIPSRSPNLYIPNQSHLSPQQQLLDSARPYPDVHSNGYYRPPPHPSPIRESELFHPQPRPPGNARL